MQVVNAHKKQKFTCEIPTIGICSGNDSNEILWIATVQNIILTNSLTLYDVLVIPEYCVTLISVYKLIVRI